MVHQMTVERRERIMGQSEAAVISPEERVKHGKYSNVGKTNRILFHRSSSTPTFALYLLTTLGNHLPIIVFT